jgi:predicted DNA binding protein
MKKLTLKIRLKPIVEPFAKIHLQLDKIKRIELIEILKLDFEQGIKLALVEIHTTEQYQLEDVVLFGSTKIVATLNQKDHIYTCIIKAIIPRRFIPLSKEFLDVSIMWDTPTYITKDEIVFTVVGLPAELDTFIRLFKKFAYIEHISFHTPLLTHDSMISRLSDKQKIVLTKAKQQGYYEYPRKITTNQLSKSIGLSKATTIEHLRKAENKIINSLLAGYE